MEDHVMRVAAVLLMELTALSVFSSLAVAAEVTGIPKEALAEMQYRVGKWTSTGFVNGVEQPQLGVETTRWCPGRHCIRISGSFEERGVGIQISGLVGWDAEKKQLVEHWYASDGSYATFSYFLDKKKDAWVGTFKWVYADGKVHAGESIVEKKNNDLWEWNASCLDDGKKRTWKTINQRVKK
jgi:hypothetical protein